MDTDVRLHPDAKCRVSSTSLSNEITHNWVYLAVHSPSCDPQSFKKIFIASWNELWSSTRFNFRFFIFVPLRNIIRIHGMNFQIYVDDTLFILLTLKYCLCFCHFACMKNVINLINWLIHKFLFQAANPQIGVAKTRECSSINDINNYLIIKTNKLICSVL